MESSAFFLQSKYINTYIGRTHLSASTPQRQKGEILFFSILPKTTYLPTYPPLHSSLSLTLLNAATSPLPLPLNHIPHHPHLPCLPRLNDPPFIKPDGEIRIPDRLKAMGNRNDRALPHFLAEDLLDMSGGLGIYRCRCLAGKG